MFISTPGKSNNASERAFIASVLLKKRILINLKKMQYLVDISDKAWRVVMYWIMNWLVML